MRDGRDFGSPYRTARGPSGGGETDTETPQPLNGEGGGDGVNLTQLNTRCTVTTERIGSESEGSRKTRIGS